ncbi:MAG: GNAT family N-acetyltransferase [Chloroflexi bacterium]|nr:GNAT family N-acetyltransferase [Chloroflexota bacterium]
MMETRGEKVLLRDKTLDDAIDDYRWRTDPELATFDAVPPLRMAFQDFLTIYSEELRYPTPRQKNFAIVDLATGKHIGNIMYYDIDEYRRQAELGIMIGEREYWSHGYGTDALTTLLRHIFSTTRLERIYLHTLDWNHRAQRAFEKVGFVPISTVTRRGHTFVAMEIYRDRFESGKSPARTQVQAQDSTRADACRAPPAAWSAQPCHLPAVLDSARAFVSHQGVCVAHLTCQSSGHARRGATGEEKRSW